MVDWTSVPAKAWGWIRKNGVNTGIELLINFLLPFAIYTTLQHRLGDVRALMASSAPPILWSLIEFARRRRVDAVSMLVLGGIALSLLAFLGGGGARFLQLRERLVTALIGLLFLGSAAIGKPLIYELARAGIKRRSPDQLEQFSALRDNVDFRRMMTIMTLVWGFGLLCEAAVAVVLVFTLSIRQYLLVSPLVGFSMVGALSAWSAWYGVRAGRGMEARMKAAAAATAAPTAEIETGPG